MGFEEMIKLEQVYEAWKDFSVCKRKKKDVMSFEAHLEDELFMLTNDLQTGQYLHGSYERFIVHEPKRRIIHKATVRDRIVHRLLYNALMPMFHSQWLDCSFSCRPGFGQHRAQAAVRKGLRQATRNGSRECWTLKCDIRKFFDSVNHRILLSLLFHRVSDERLRELLNQIVTSFSVVDEKGLPIGNLTSQIFANVYLHELDWYVRQELKHHWYYRYADDILFLCETKDEALRLLDCVEGFLTRRLALNLHPSKTFLRKSTWGVDWLGRVFLPGYELMRPSTRRRMMRKGGRYNVVSYHGLLMWTARRSIDTLLLQKIAFARDGDTIRSVGY